MELKQENKQIKEIPSVLIDSEDLEFITKVNFLIKI